MASRILYPPSVDSYMPAFKVGNTAVCRVYYSLSRYNGGTDFSSVHISVVKQSTGMNAVNIRENDITTGRYRSAGIIINAPKAAVDGNNNLYYVDIYNNDLDGGWTSGWIYKIQIRLSEKNYDGSTPLSVWLNTNTSSFSEWSTICIVKATERIDYEIPILEIDTRNENNSSDVESRTLNTTTLQLSGRFYRKDESELIKYSEFTLYDNNDNIIEETGRIYSNQYQDSDSFNYTMKTELIDGDTYKLAFKYTTINGYVDGFYSWDEDEDKRYIFECSTVTLDRPPCRILTVENDADEVLKEITTLHMEEEEGRVGLKLFAPNNDPYSGNLCIRRSDSRTDFKIWEDIFVYVAKGENINDIPIFYDYTIESGVWYQYGIQIVEGDDIKTAYRGDLETLFNPVMRQFNYCFLLGKNNQQLKLMFDNAMGNFKYQIFDSKNDPIGSQFTNIARNAATYYRTFPINGLISFWMDENYLFCNKTVVYNYEDVIDLYNDYNKKNNIVQYDYIYERDFREKVLEFLQNGEYKLFKSPTEGNIIVRLMDVNCVPNQQLGRMLYSFTSNAYEMDKCTMENYFKYGFYNLIPIESDFSTYETRLGQIQMDFPVGSNVFEEIYKKYDSGDLNIGGYMKKIGNIHHIKITFDEKPLRILNSGNEMVVGNNFTINGRLITVYNPIRMYEFDNRLVYTTKDSLILLGDAEGRINTIHATIDFLYEIKIDVYEQKRIEKREIKRGIGQFFGECKPDENIYNDIYYKYHIEWDTAFQKVTSLNSIEIEANPGAVFEIQDESEVTPEEHVVGATGQLRFYDIENIIKLNYLGIKNLTTGNIDKIKTDVLVNYAYILLEGVYKEEI